MLFQYTTLSADSIRLVRFHLSSTPTDISLTLHHQDNYYHAGSANYTVLLASERDDGHHESKSLTLHGRTRLVPAAVWEALSSILRQQPQQQQQQQQQHQQCQSPGVDQRAFLWIDAVCVNQGDDVEKATHYRQLSRIYECAEKVVVWCGARSDAAGENATFELMRRVAEQREAGESIGESQVSEEERIAMQRLCDGIAPALANIADIRRAKKVELMWDGYIADLKWFDACRTLMDTSDTNPAKQASSERAAL